MKKIVYIILSTILMIPFGINALEIEGLESKHVIVYNLDESKIIYEEKSEEITSIASLTKIMTTLVAIESIDDLDEKVTITESMLNGIPYDASVAGLQVGDVLTYKDLLYSSMIPSGADATQALAISLTGSISNFVEKMNAKARELKLENTSFANTTGLDTSGHYSTAKDILSLLNHALENKTFKEIFETKSYTTTNGIILKSTLDYYNKTLNYDLSFVKGSKTGYTGKAGLCLATLSNIDNTNIITITINASYEDRNKNVKDLNRIYKSLKSNYIKVNIIEEGDILTTLETKFAKELNTLIRSDVNITRYIEKPYNEDKVKIEYAGEQVISSTTKKGTEVGTIKVYYDEELLEEIPAVISDTLHFSVFNYLKENIIYYVLLILIVLGTIHTLRKPKRARYDMNPVSWT